jgi:predicted phage-related endonuclease
MSHVTNAQGGVMSANSGKIERRTFIGGSDAKIVLGTDENALTRLWREKRGRADPADLSDNLIVQLGLATEDLNRRWYERNNQHCVRDVQRWLKHRTVPWMAATLDGIVEQTGAVFEAKFMLPWSFCEEAAAQKHAAQLQHNMLVVGTKHAVLSIITGGGKWVELKIPADPFGAACKLENPLGSLMPSRRSRALKRSASST